MEKAYHTKTEIATAFKTLLEKENFRKMNVAQITDKAGVSRKSFYYHFQDKYDMVNWIFQTEFVDEMKTHNIYGWGALESLCHYLYSDAQYHRKLLHISGANSLSEHIGKYIREQVLMELSTDTMAEMKSVLITDSILVMIKRWLYEMQTLSASAFVQLMYEMIADSRKIIASAGLRKSTMKPAFFKAG